MEPAAGARRQAISPQRVRRGLGDAREDRMSFSVEGNYFEVCSCDVSCNCVWLGEATHEGCDVLLAWHVSSGSKDGVDLSGLNAVMAGRSPKRRTGGSLHAEVAGALSMSSDQFVGMDGEGPAVIENAPIGAVTQPLRQAKAKAVSYHGHWNAEFDGTNSFVTDFRYEG